MSACSQLRLDQLATAMESGFACGRSNLVDQGLLHLRPFNIGRNGEIDLTREYRVPSEIAPRSKTSLHAGDILFNNTNSPALVGKTAVVRENFNAGFSNHVTRIRLDPARCDPMFVAAHLRRLWMQGHFRDHCTQWVSQAAYGTRLLSRLRVPLPPLDEQRRIVDILNRAARIETLRTRSAECLREFVPALFVKMFGDQKEIRSRFPCLPLREVATITSGATKGRKIDPADAVDVPYLRVANVQDGFLTLDEIKTITIRRGEEQQYALAPGDLVMTEGGDQDKLGRAAIWNGELPYCAHQNHVFRVRPRADVVSTHYLRDVVGSAYGKAYFLSVAKRTTGIASVNKTQLGGFSVPVPSMELQARYAEFVAGARSVAVVAAAATARAAAVSASLMHRLLENPGRSQVRKAIWKEHYG